MKSKRKPSPLGCPKCGSAAIEQVGGLWSCGRCGHNSTKKFPTIGALSRRKDVDYMEPEGSSKGMGSGCFIVRPAGNKYS